MNARVVLDPAVSFAALDPLWVFTSSGLAVVLAPGPRPGAPDYDEVCTADVGVVAVDDDDREIEWREDEGVVAVTRANGPAERVTPEWLRIDLCFGSVEVLGDAAAPMHDLARRLEDRLTGPLLDALHARALAALGRSQRFASDFRWSTYIPGDLIGLADALHEVRLDLYELPRGRAVRAEVAYCVVPSCTCTRFQVRLYDVDSEDDDAYVGDIDSPIDPENDPEVHALHAEAGEEETVADAWAAFCRRHSDFAVFAQQHRQIRAWAAPFVQRILDGAPRPKVGRNEPCPCGSGKKYKRCCWLTDAELEGSVAGFRVVP